jgi:chemotaxis protein CheX
MMDVRYINPFVKSVSNATLTMLGIEAQALQPIVKKENRAHGDISGIIGIASANIYGSVAISMPSETAVELFNKMMGDSATSITDDVRDMVGEFANIVAGSAKKDLAEMDLSFDISIPTVVVGQNHIISHKGGIPVVVIPFKFGNYVFEMEISIKARTEETVASPLAAGHSL